MDVWNERNGFELRADFTDEFDAPTIPPSIHWRLDCETTGTVLQDFVEVAPVIEVSEAGIVEAYAIIDVDSQLNAIQKNNNKQELKTLLVVSGLNTAREFSEPYQYYVKNLRGRS